MQGFPVTPIIYHLHNLEDFRMTETVLGIQFVALKEIIRRKFPVSAVVVPDNIYVRREDLINTCSYKDRLSFDQV